VLKRIESEILRSVEERMIQGLQQANVSVVSQADIVVAEEVTDSTRDTSNKRSLGLMGLFFVLFVGGIVFGLMYALGASDEEQTPSPDLSSQGVERGEASPVSTLVPSTAPFPLVPVDSLLDELGGSIAPTDPDLFLLDDPTSPQAQALAWLQSDLITRTPGRSTETVLERYALAVLFYSTSGESSWSFPSMNSDDVCTWNMKEKGGVGVYCGSAQDAVVDLQLASLVLEGNIPWELVLLSNLETINFHANALTGTIPSRITELKHLRAISGSRNQLTGTLPARFAPVTQAIRLEGNRFTGPIPATWGMIMPGLKYVQIGENRLTGTFPAAFGRLANLTELEIDRNFLIGTIPSELRQLSSLKRLMIHTNSFTGSVNDTLCDPHGFDINELTADCDQVVCSCCTTCCYGLGGLNDAGIFILNCSWGI